MHALAASLLSFLLLTPLANGWLGVYLATDGEQAVVTEVIPGTPAQKAGLKSGDVLLAVGDTATPTRDKFIAEIQGKAPGDRVKIKLRRGDRERVVVVRLGERPEIVGAGAEQPPAPPAPPAGATAPARSAPAVEIGQAVEIGRTGEVQGQAVASDEKGYLGVSVRESQDGLTIDRILEGGPCAKSGLTKGDVLQSIGDRRVRSLDDLDVAMKKVHPGTKVAMGVVSGNAKKSLMITVGRRPGSGRATIARAIETVELTDVTEAESREPVEAVVVEEQVEEVVVEEVATEARPERAARVIRPGRRAQAGGRDQGAAGEAAVPPRPAGPRQATRPVRPSRAARARSEAGPAGDYNLQKELRELRKELKELRKLLEEMRGGKNGGE